MRWWVVLLLLPHASALEAHAEGPEAPVVPDAVAAARLAVAVDCLTLWARDGTTLAVDIEAPDGVVVSGPTSIEVPRSACPAPDGNATREQGYEVSVRPDAPAGRNLTVAFVVRLPPGGLDAERSATARIQVVPAYAGLFLVRVDRPIQRAGGDEASFDLTIENRGNGAGRAAFAAEVPTGARVAFPADVVVPAGQERVVGVVLHLPEGAWSQVSARIAVEISQDGTGADPQTHHASLLVRNGNGLERVASPGPAVGPALALLAAGAAVLARRR